MKKILAMIFALLMMIGCVALAEDMTGDWYSDMFGIPVTMTLNADGTYALEVMGETENGTWVLEDETMIMDKGTEFEAPLDYDAAAVTLTMSDGDMEIVFGREAVEAFTPAEPRDDAALEEFAGRWQATHVYFLDMLMDTELAGMTMTLEIQDTTVTLALNTGEETDDVDTIEGVFAEGAITLTFPAEDEWSEDTVFVIKLLEDGMMSCETQMMDLPLIFYLDAAPAEDVAEQPEYYEDYEDYEDYEYYEDYEDYEMPEATPIGTEGEAYFGTWTADMYGMAVVLTLNQDGTCTMEMMGEADVGVWSVVDGKADIMGDEIYIDGDGNLVYESADMTFTKSEGEVATEEMSEDEMLLAMMAMLAQMEDSEDSSGESADDTESDEEFSYLDKVFELTKAETVYEGQSYPADVEPFGEYKVCLNSDGTAMFVQADMEIPTEYLSWTTDDEGSYVLDYSVYGMSMMTFVFKPVDESLTMDYYGTLMTFTPAE